MTTTWLEAYEKRVTERYRELIAPSFASAFDITDWLPTGDMYAEIPVGQQFPREQWVTMPIRRAAILITIDRTLDQWDTLSGEQRWQVAFLLAYGGRERIA